MSGPLGQVVREPAGISQIVWHNNKYIHRADNISPFILNLSGQANNNSRVSKIEITALTGTACAKQANSYGMLKHNNDKDTAS